MIGAVSGILPVGLLPWLPPPPLLGLVAIAGLGLLFWACVSSRFLSGALLGLVLASLQGHVLLEHRLSDSCVGINLTLQGVIGSLPRISQLPDDTLRQRFEFLAQSLTPSRCMGPRKILLSYYGPRTLVPGEVWQMEARLKKPWGLSNPGSFNMQAWFASSGIDAVGSVRANRAKRLATASGLSGVHHRLRLSVRERIAAVELPAGARAILAAVTVADKSGIDGQMWTLFQQFGINHLLVISGLHVGLVASIGYLLGKVLARIILVTGQVVAWLPPALAFLIALAYAALAGFSLPTQRALIMLGCFCLAPVLGRESAPWNSLLLAAFLILLLNAMAPLESGFWLSFGAVAALLWLAPWQGGRSLPATLAGTHLFMSLVMVPMGGWWFGGASLAAAPANFLLIPLIGMVIVPLALAATAFHFAGVSLDVYLWQWAGLPLSYLLPLAKAMAASMGRWFYLPLTPGLLSVVLALGALILFALPLCWKRGLAMLILFVPVFTPVNGMNQLEQRLIAFLDVGQGTSVLIQSGPRALLYDTGGGDPAGSNMARSVVLPYILQRGLRRLDTLIVSHPDRDHSAGTDSIQGAMPVDRFMRGGKWPPQTPGRPCETGQAWRWPSGERFQIMAPGLIEQATSNNASCVLMVDMGEIRLLLPGDIDTGQELELVRYWRDELKSDFLMAGHHGSRTSSGPTWLKYVQASELIITSGYANRFGHPHPDVVARLETSGARVSQTATDGALEIVINTDKEPELRSYRRLQWRFWM
jgi:competence protein ComEC